MIVTLKSLTKENARIKSANDLLVERNANLEPELLQLEKMKMDCKIVRDEIVVVLKREEILKRQLEREQEIIERWTVARDVIDNMATTQILEKKTKQAWK